MSGPGVREAWSPKIATKLSVHTTPLDQALADTLTTYGRR
jgi:hypothetical protein